jgi:hypothetical protein
VVTAGCTPENIKASITQRSALRRQTAMYRPNCGAPAVSLGLTAASPQMKPSEESRASVIASGFQVTLIRILPRERRQQPFGFHGADHHRGSGPKQHALGIEVALQHRCETGITAPDRGRLVCGHE